MRAVFTKLVNFKASPEQHEAWQEAAYKRRMSFGRWAREQLDSGLELGTVSKAYIGVATPAPEAKPNLESLARELLERASQPKSKCDRRLPKGAFCKTCGRIHG